MIGAPAAAIVELARHCRVERLGFFDGWTLDRWELDEPAREALIKAYEASRLPDEDSALLESIRAVGLDLERLFRYSRGEDPAMIRADMVEIAAAASVVAKDSAPIEFLHMPNVPKPFRKLSAPGIDVLAPLLRVGVGGRTLSRGEGLIVCSAKHTTASAGDLRRKLTASLIRDMELPALAMQVRVLIHKLRGQHHDVTRLWFALVDFPNPGLLNLIGVAGADPNMGLESQKTRLPKVDDSLYTFRMILIDGLPDLHRRWDGSDSD